MSKTLLFIPDISGFTEFVNSVEISHSKHITKEILELLIHEIGDELILAEVEGDALFYYQDAEKISAERFLKLVNQLYRAFHAFINFYRYQRVCNCGACSSAVDLKLKFIVHEGETEMIEVNGNVKPFGAEVILAHRLLKNEVKSNEYVLFGKAYCLSNGPTIEKQFPSLEDFENLIDGKTVRYSAAEMIPPEPIKPLALDYPQLEGLPFITESITIDAPPDQVYQIIVDFEQRIKWNEGVEQIKFKEALNQVNAEHVCIINGNDINFKTVFKNFDAEVYTYIEEGSNIPFLECLYSIMKVEAANGKSKVLASIHLRPKNLWGKLLMPLLKNQIKKGIRKSLIKLSKLF